MSRFDLSDDDFARVEEFLPKRGRTGRRGRPLKADPRDLLNGMLWIAHTGAPWEDLPERYGSAKTVNRWFLRWSQDGTLLWIFQALAHPELADTDLLSMDGTIVRAHKASAGARKKKGDSPAEGKVTIQSPEESRRAQALGKSKGGLTTKVHLACDGQGRPLRALLSPGQEAEVTHAPELLRGLGEEFGFLAVAGDKGYQSAALSRQALVEELMEPVIASKKLKGKDEYPESARGFDKLLYKGRSMIECLNGRLKEMRRIATRYDKLATSYLGFIYLGFIKIWLREL